MIELIKAYEEYIALLEKETNDLVPFAIAHGWESKLFEEGKRLRTKIDKLKVWCDNNKDNVKLWE